jgi:hypothetical protein
VRSGLGSDGCSERDRRHASACAAWGIGTRTRERGAHARDFHRLAAADEPARTSRGGRPAAPSPAPPSRARTGEPPHSSSTSLEKE